MSDKISSLTTDTFKNAIAETSTAVVAFWAPWCAPCRTMGAILEELAGEVDDSTKIFKVDVDQHALLAGQFSIRSIPTLLIFKDGNLAHTIVGVTQKDALKAKLS